MLRMTMLTLAINWSIKCICLYRFDIIVLVTRGTCHCVLIRGADLFNYHCVLAEMFFKAGFSILLVFSTIAVARDTDAVKAGGLGSQCMSILPICSIAVLLY